MAEGQAALAVLGLSSLLKKKTERLIVMQYIHTDKKNTIYKR